MIIMVGIAATTKRPVNSYQMAGFQVAPGLLIVRAHAIHGRRERATGKPRLL